MFIIISFLKACTVLYVIVRTFTVRTVNCRNHSNHICNMDVELSDTLNKSWKENKSNFGYRMLAKMGWSEDKGKSVVVRVCICMLRNLILTAQCFCLC